MSISKPTPSFKKKQAQKILFMMLTCFFGAFLVDFVQAFSFALVEVLPSTFAIITAPLKDDQSRMRPVVNLHCLPRMPFPVGHHGICTRRDRNRIENLFCATEQALHCANPNQSSFQKTCSQGADFVGESSADIPPSAPD